MTSNIEQCRGTEPDCVAHPKNRDIRIPLNTSSYIVNIHETTGACEGKKKTRQPLMHRCHKRDAANTPCVVPQQPAGP